MSGGLRVLIVDDDVLLARIIGRQLQARGHRVLFAHSADEAARAMGVQPSERPDIILMDAVLQRESGLAVIERLQQISNAPIVMMTGHFDEEFRRDALTAGARASVAKPMDFADLDSLLRGIAAGG